MSNITPYNIDDYSNPIVDNYRELDLLLFVHIASLLNDSNKYDDVLQWQRDKLSHSKQVNNYAVKELSRISKISTQAIKEVLEKAGYDTVDSVDEEIVALGLLKLPSVTELTLLEQATKTLFDDINFNINQKLITNNYGRGLVTKMYEDIINDSVTKVLSSQTTIAKAVEQSVFNMSDKGLPSGFVDKGGYRWSTERYTQAVIKTTVNNTYNELRLSRMAEYDVHTVLVSTISDSAPRCVHIQGAVVDTRPVSQNDSKFKSVYDYGYGRADAHRGVNCRHMWFPYIDGANTNNQKQFNVEDADKNYIISQRQRALERRIRKTKKNLAISKELNSDKQAHYSRLLRKQQADMRKHVADNDLTRRYDREKVEK